jgi:2-amino-4-hydroxy-6-hydroxymethyldihydropteridine diphosphokinase
MIAGGSAGFNCSYNSSMRVAGYVGLGSNLGNREANLRAGVVGMIRRGLSPEAISSVWETEAVGTGEPGWFLNMVARIGTPLAPEDVLARLLEVEAEVGRVRTSRNAPRVLDLDLLLLGDHRRQGEGLVLPHPRMWERRFVLAPLQEIAPGLVHPASGRTVREELATLLDPHAVRKVGALALAGWRPV